MQLHNEADGRLHAFTCTSRSMTLGENWLRVSATARRCIWSTLERPGRWVCVSSSVSSRQCRGVKATLVARPSLQVEEWREREERERLSAFCRLSSTSSRSSSDCSPVNSVSYT